MMRDEMLERLPPSQAARKRKARERVLGRLHLMTAHKAFATWHAALRPDVFDAPVTCSAHRRGRGPLKQQGTDKARSPSWESDCVSGSEEGALDAEEAAGLAKRIDRLDARVKALEPRLDQTAHDVRDIKHLLLCMVSPTSSSARVRQDGGGGSSSHKGPMPAAIVQQMAADNVWVNGKRRGPSPWLVSLSSPARDKSETISPARGSTSSALTPSNSTAQALSFPSALRQTSFQSPLPFKPGTCSPLASLLRGPSSEDVQYIASLVIGAYSLTNADLHTVCCVFDDVNLPHRSYAALRPAGRSGPGQGG